MLTFTFVQLLCLRTSKPPVFVYTVILKTVDDYTYYKHSNYVYPSEFSASAPPNLYNLFYVACMPKQRAICINKKAPSRYRHLKSA